MIAGIFILIIIMVAHTVIEYIPIATLTGVLFMVVLNTFNWRSVKFITIYKINYNKKKICNFFKKFIIVVNYS